MITSLALNGFTYGVVFIFPFVVCWMISFTIATEGFFPELPHKTKVFVSLMISIVLIWGLTLGAILIFRHFFKAGLEELLSEPLQGHSAKIAFQTMLAQDFKLLVGWMLAGSLGYVAGK